MFSFTIYATILFHECKVGGRKNLGLAEPPDVGIRHRLTTEQAGNSDSERIGMGREAR